MQNRTAPAPLLPRPLALPIRALPASIHSHAAAALLNQAFAPALEEGELDFLAGRMMRIRVTDAGVSLDLTLRDGALRAARTRRPPDLSIEGTAYDYLLLATRREDADTLFFERRLRLGGNTELGLYVKNFLDAFEPGDRLQRVLDLLDRGMARFGHAS